MIEVGAVGLGRILLPARAATTAYRKTVGRGGTSLV